MITFLPRLWAESPAAALILAAACLYLLVAGARLAWVDARTHRLPNRIIFPSYPIALVLLWATALMAGDWGRFGMVAAGAGVLFGLYLLLHLLYPAGMGLGDVKLAGILGMYLGYLGWEHLLMGTLAAFLCGGLFGVVLILLRRAGAKTAIAFGPFMIGGAVLGLLLPA